MFTGGVPRVYAVPGPPEEALRPAPGDGASPEGRQCPAQLPHTVHGGGAEEGSGNEGAAATTSRPAPLIVITDIATVIINIDIVIIYRNCNLVIHIDIVIAETVTVIIETVSW